jgi:hypothetical protein
MKKSEAKGYIRGRMDSVYKGQNKIMSEIQILEDRIADYDVPDENDLQTLDLLRENIKQSNIMVATFQECLEILS